MLDSAPRLPALISDGVVALEGTSLAATDHSRFRVGKRRLLPSTRNELSFREWRQPGLRDCRRCL